jgi:hypothetical protein
MRFVLLASLLPLAATAPWQEPAHGHPAGQCPPFNNGTFNLHQFQAYPENAAWDWHNCLLYIT